MNRLLNRFFYNFIYFIINRNFCFIFFECIIHYSSFSLEEIKLIFIVSWIFRPSNFLRSFMIAFKYGIILLRYWNECFISISIVFIFNIASAPKVTYSDWFIIILFYLIKPICNIPYYSAFDCFFFFESKKISYSLNYVAIYFFFSLKICFTSLILSSLYLFQVFSLSKSKRVSCTPKILFTFVFWAFFCLNCSILIMMREKLKVF